MNSSDRGTLFALPVSLPKHPAKYTDVLLGEFAKMLDGRKSILDPFGGTGKVHLLSKWLPDARIYATEIEHEWAFFNRKNIVANALFLPFTKNAFDAICTSPTYGNHMADQSKGDVADRHRKAKTNKYFALLGRKLHPQNSGQLHWNKGYQEFHVQVWEVLRVLKIGGSFVLNIKNHIRNGQEQFVTEWHIETLLALGCEVVEHKKIEVPSMRFGRNAEKRVPYESVILLRKHQPSSMPAELKVEKPA